MGNNTTLEDRWVADQIDGLKRLLDELGEQYPDAIVLGHRDLPGAATLCPGLDVRNLLGLSPLIDDENEQGTIPVEGD